MLESVVARIVNNLLGKYVEELDTEGLNVGIFSGTVSLRNLKLKPSCLYELDLPIEVGYGIIGELSFQIPWNCFAAKPIHFVLQDLLIVAHPLGHLPYNEDRDRELRRSAAKRILSRIENDHSSFIQGFLDALLPLFGHTVQLHIRNVHIRYEDAAAGIAVGLLVQEFSIETTNSKWKPVSQNTGGSVYQLLRMEAFSLYVNTKLPQSHLVIGDDAWVQHMRTAFEQFQLKGSPLNLVLKPVNAKLKVIVGDDAPLLVDIVVQDVVLVLTDTQLSALRHTLQYLHRIQFYRKYLAKRPTTSVRGNCSNWWKYSLIAVLEQRVLPYTWSRFSLLRKSYREYKDLYKRCIQQPSDTELKLDLQHVEDNLPLFCVVIARELAKSEVLQDGLENVLLSDKQGRYRLHVRSLSKETEEPRPFIEFKLNLTVDNVSVSLLRDGREVLCAGLGGCVSSFELRKDDAWRASARLASILVEGTSNDSELVTLLSSSSPAGSQTAHDGVSCFSMDVEQKPLTNLETAKYGLSVTLTPLEIIYQEHAFSEILNCLADVEWNHLLKTDSPSLTFSSGSLLTWDFHASIALPRIILPEAGSLQKPGLVLIIDPGKWCVETELQPHLTAEELAEMTQMELEERLYHRFQLQWSDLQLLMTDSGEEWRDLAVRDESIGHILSRMSGSLTVSVSTKQEYRLLPRLKLNLAVPFVHGCVSERRVEQLQHLISNVPVPRIAHRLVMFAPAPELWPEDRVQPEATVSDFVSLTQKIIITQLKRQQTGESILNNVPLKGTLDGSFVNIDKIGSETSDEDMELWARAVDHPGFEDNVSPHNSITVLLRVTVKELVLNLPKCVEFQERAYLMVRVGYASVDVALMEYGPAVQLAVRAFQLIDKQHISANGEYLEMVSTNGDQDFFNLLYRKVLADCPDFKSHFHAVEESLVVDLGSMSLVLRRDAYQNMFYFLRRISNQVTDKPLIPHSRKLWQKIKSLVPLLESRDVPVPPGGIKFSYSMHLAKLQARLREADIDMLDISIRGLGGDWFLRANDRLILRLHLQGLAIDDLSETTLYPQIVSQDEDEVFELKLIRLNGGTETRRNVAQGKFKLTLGRLHVLFAHHVLQTFQRFNTLFQNEATKILRDFVENWADNSWLAEYRNCQRAWHLSLDLHLPVILLPPGSTAANLFIVNSGDLTVENFIKEDATGHVVDNILIRVGNTFITRGLMRLTGEVESREEFLEHVKLQVDIKRSLTGVTGVDIVSSIDNVRVCMGQRDFGLVLNLLAANHSITHFLDLLETPSVNDPFELKNLQIFLRDGNSRRRDSSFRFTLDNFILTLYIDMDEQLSSPVRDVSHALCKLQFDDLVTQMETQATGLSEFRLSIKSVILDDIRADTSVFVQRILGPRFRDDNVNSAISVSSPPLVDVVGKENERGDRCFDILVEKTRVNLTVGFIAALVKFVDDSLPTLRDESGGCDNLGYVADNTPNKCWKDTSRCVDHVHDNLATFQKGLSLSLQLKRPELAFVASCNGDAKEMVGFVTRCEIFVDWSCSPGREELVVRFADLRLTTSKLGPMVMRPCDVQMVRNATAAAGVRVTVDVSPVYFTLGSDVFTAVSSIFDEFEMVFPKRRESNAAPLAQLLEFEDLWSQKKLSTCCETALNYQYVDAGHSTPHSFPVASPAESVAVNVAKITTVVGLQMQNHCQPLFVGKSSVKLQAQDWNTSIVFNGEVQMEIACWNECLETWEPVLQPWSLLCRMYQSCALPISPSAVRSSRSLASRTATPPAVRRSADSATETDSDSDDSDPAMTFIKPDQFHLGPDATRPNDGLPNVPDLEVDDGVIGRLHSSIVHLFVKDDESSDDGEDETSEDVETESVTSGTRSPRFSPTERAVFLNKHADSIDSGLETEAVDRQAVHVLIHAASPLRLTITPNVLTLIEKLKNTDNFSPTAKRVVNYLGPGSVVSLLQGDSILACSKFDHDSGASTPEMTPPASPAHFQPRPSYVNWDEGRTSPDLSYPRENLDELNERLRGFKLNVQVPGFDSVTIPVGKLIGKREVKLTPIRSGVQFIAVITTARSADVTHYSVTSSFQIHNSTMYPIGIYYKKSCLLNIGETVIGESANPFDEATRLTVVAPDDTYHVPLIICHYAQLYFLPLHLTNHALSLDGIAWPDVKTHTDAIHDYVYASDDNSLFGFKVCWKNDGLVRITPPLLLRNVLPCACELKLPNDQTIRLEAGEESHVYSVDLRTQFQMSLVVPDYAGLAWQAGFHIGPDSKEKLVVMNADQDTDGGNKQLAVNILVLRSQTDVLLLYEPYWLLNRTGLALLIRGSGSHVIQEWTDSKPLLFTYRKPRSRTVRLRVLTSSWSPAFSLDAVGCSGLIVCRDRERNKKFRVIMDCVPCHVEPILSRTITFLPYITVENGCKKHLRFMEDNEKADLWFGISPGQSIPFWPDTETMQMMVRLRDSKNSSVPFPISSPHVTALRIDKGYSLTVEVTGGDLKPLRVLLRPYRTGDAPVRVENLCVDLFLRLRQKDCPQVALLSPNHSLLYTWDDPCKERTLLWSIYNNAGQELSAHWQNDAYGEERVTFRSVRYNPETAGSPESSDTSDEEPSLTNDPSVSKRIRKDTIVVYWSSFLQGGQRVLLITEDERLARKARRVVESERSSIELFCALYSCSISLLNNDANGVLREVAHLTVNSSPAQWELNVGDRCKTLTADVASYLETNYANNVSQPKIGDLLQVDFGKMQMTRPLFGSLRRRQRAALWFQYRSSLHLSVVQMHIYRMQLDDQRNQAAVPCVFHVSPNATNHPAFEATLLWRHGVNEENSIKFTSMTAQDHVVHLDSDWFMELCDIGQKLCPRRDIQSRMRDDITRLHTQSASHVLQILEEASQAFIEQLHFGSLGLTITLWPSGVYTGRKLNYPVPDVFAGLLSAIHAMPAPISNIPIRFRDFEQKRERFSIERVVSHYRMQLLQQLHVLILGLNVLATPSARIEPTGQPRKEIVMFPEEFSKALSLEAETKMAARMLTDKGLSVPDGLSHASRSFPLGCMLAVSSLGIGSSRGNACSGWEAFSRGAGRTAVALLTALDSDSKSTLHNPLHMLMDQISRCVKSVQCRLRAPLTINHILGVRPFSIIESQGSTLLYGLNRGRYNCDRYWSHSPLNSKLSSCLLITLERLLLAEQVGKSNIFDTTWTCCLSSIQNVSISGSSIVISTMVGSDVTEREIPCWDPQVLAYLHDRVKEVIQLTANA